MPVKARPTGRPSCEELIQNLFADRALIIAANRGPITFERDEAGKLSFQRGAGGLVTALTGLAGQVQATWIGCARTEADRAWGRGTVPVGKAGGSLDVHFLSPDPESYEGYYNIIANPLLWFLQHSMWDVPRAPIIDRETWLAWKGGYMAINRQFADAVIEEVRRQEKPAVAMLQDYHLYLAPRLIWENMRPAERPTLVHFVHIPWPGPEYWGILPPEMRQAILDGLCAVDLLGFQTHEDGLNFIRTCETFLPRAAVKYKQGRIWYRNHKTHVRDFPISIDVDALRSLAGSEEVSTYREEIQELVGDRKLILRIDRLEPSKNIVRGFQAFEDLLETHPEHHREVKFLALLVPSRLGVDEYRDYLDEIMAAAGRINATYGDSDWEPVRLLVGDNYARAIGAMQLHDVLLVNAIADGMNLVAKEGSIVNEKDGVLILSERAGARQQLGSGALVISPCDVYATAEALHEALTLPPEEKSARAEHLGQLVDREDITDWLCRQLESLRRLNL